MNILCITGAASTEFDLVSAQLFASGLVSAKSIERETSIGMAEWHKITSSAFKQGKQPGRLWEQLAGDLLLANIQHEQWGWAETQTTSALDFWAGFEPNIKFLLLTCSPEDYLAQQLLAEKDEDPKSEHVYLKEWQDEHEKLLSFYLANAERCILMEARKAAANPKALAEKLGEHWQFHLDIDTGRLPALSGQDKHKAPATLARYIATQAFKEHSKPIQPFNDELKAAQYPLVDPDTQEDTEGNLLSSADISLSSLLKDYQRRCEQDLTEAERQKLTQLKQENAQLLNQLQEVHQHLKNAEQQKRQLQSELEEVKRLPSPEQKLAEKHLAESQQENELLLLQLHQVQEELEATFTKSKQNEQSLAQARAEASQLTQAQDQAKQQLNKTQQANNQLSKERDALSKQLQDHQQKLDEGKQENELLLLQLHQVQEELEATFTKGKQNEQALAQARAEASQLTQARDQAKQQLNKTQQANNQLSKERDKLSKQLQDHQQKLDEGKQENELLLLQLHQVQEELEHYFVQHQKLSEEMAQLKQQKRKLKQQYNQSKSQLPASSGLFKRKRNERPPSLEFESVQLRHEQVNPDYEHVWISLQAPSFGSSIADQWHFRLSCAGVQPGKFGQQPKLELPEQEDQLLENWFPESENEDGRKLELRFALPNAMDTGVWKQVKPADQQLIQALIQQLPDIVSTLKDQNAYISRDWADWEALATNMKRIHQSKANR